MLNNQMCVRLVIVLWNYAKYNNVFASDDDDFSHKYLPHIRIGPHSVKPEIYAVMNKLENQNHLSHR